MPDQSEGKGGKGGKKPVALEDDEEEAGGLLISQRGKLIGRKFLFSLLLEFLGVLFFTLFGSAALNGDNATNFGAVGNGLVLAVLVYITANVSGGHLNPAVTFATICTGHISVVKGILYMVFQIFGAIIGCLLLVGLVPDTAVGSNNDACFRPGPDVTKGQAFGWELFMTFVLVSTVYAVAIGKPNFGNVGPLIVGIALWACATSAGQYTTGSLNPARTLGPLSVFHCYNGDAWYYVLAELLGGFLAGMLAWPLYGHGRAFDSKKKSDDADGNDDEDGDKEENAGDDERMSDVERGQPAASAYSAPTGPTGALHLRPMVNEGLLANNGAHSSMPPHTGPEFKV